MLGSGQVERRFGVVGRSFKASIATSTSKFAKKI